MKKRLMRRKSKASKPKKKGKLSFITKFALVLNFVFALLLLLSWAGTYVDPSKFWPAAFISLAYPVLVALNLFFVMAWIIRLRWFFVFSLAPIILSWSLLTAHFNFSGSSKETEGVLHLKVSSYNVHAFSKNDFYNLKSSVSEDGIMKWIYTEDPDIMCIQEFYSNPTRGFNMLDTFNMMQRLPYLSKAYYRDDWMTMYMAIFTKQPIIDSGILREPDGRSYGHWVDIMVGPKKIRVVNVHLRSIKLSKEITLLDNMDPDFYNDENFKKGAKAMLRKMKQAYLARVTQSTSLENFIKNCDLPIILCGDFNDTPASYTYRKIKPHLKDAFREAGFGVAKTYNGRLPSFRIDYIFCSPEMRVNSFNISKITTSDHFPMSAIIEVE